jgi:phosphoserine phosphatase RsbU/P
MMLRVFIVDDEPPARVRLRQLLAEAGEVLVVGEAGDAIEARAAMADARPDVVFLDIEMPQMTGTSFASSLPEPRPFVVFATAFDRYALEAFAVDATDYLVKPITRARLSSTLSRIRERLARQSDLERELVAASATQALLLPRVLPSLAGYDAAALTLPARGVGGDFFLGRRVGATRLAFALGDVAGKGMSAGLVASSLQGRIESLATHGERSVSELIADVNRTLCATSDSARFATLIYLDIDAATHRLTMINAGHLPLLVAAPGVALDEWRSTAPALGVLPHAVFPARAESLAPGTTLVIYSDGVTEALDAAGDEFGDHRLHRAIAAHVHDAPIDLCRAVLDAVAAHVGHARAIDDITIMAVRRAVDTSPP